MQSFKPFDEIVLPDPRSTGYVTHGSDVGGFRQIELRDSYLRLSRLELIDDVPREVQLAFARAKYASLYSWYAYDLHPVADMAAFAALEMALRMRVALHRGQSLTRQEQKLSILLVYAVQNGLIKNQGFARVRRIAKARATEKKIMELISTLPHLDRIEVPEPTEEEVENEIDASDYINQLSKSIPIHRNELAHGTSATYAGSAATLEMVSEMINELFRSKS